MLSPGVHAPSEQDAGQPRFSLVRRELALAPAATNGATVSVAVGRQRVGNPRSCTVPLSLRRRRRRAARPARSRPRRRSRGRLPAGARLRLLRARHRPAVAARYPLGRSRERTRRALRAARRGSARRDARRRQRSGLGHGRDLAPGRAPALQLAPRPGAGHRPVGGSCFRAAPRWHPCRADARRVEAPQRMPPRRAMVTSGAGRSCSASDTAAIARRRSEADPARTPELRDERRTGRADPASARLHLLAGDGPPGPTSERTQGARGRSGA